MQKYENTIGLKTIYLTFVRRFRLILLIFVSIVSVSFIVTNFFIKKTYQSSSTITKEVVFTANHYQNAQLTIKSESVLATVATNLENNGILHSNGSKITSNEINSGLSFSAFSSSNPSLSLTIYFQTTDKKIAQSVLYEITSVSVSTLKNSKDFAQTYISQDATKPYKNSKENQYFLISLAVGIVLSLGIPFIFEIVSDEVYDEDDVALLGSPSYGLIVSKK